GERLEAIAAEHRDAKSMLQEWSQAEGHGTPFYKDISRKGPDHAPVFTVEVVAGKLKPERATGTSKREAQGAAASALLAREGVAIEP
ncbi:MAG: putative dsRNA-binding protein, partial [Pseudomonadota bacterium]